MKRLSALIAIALVGGVGFAQAQSWASLSAVVLNNNGTPYWDHTSSDGIHCNVGDVLTGVAGSAGNACANQRPNTWLPYTGVHPTEFLQTSGGAPSFMFDAGTYTFSLLQGTGNNGGDIAGANQDWGYFELTGQQTIVRTSLNNGIPSGPVDISDPWGLYIQMTNGTYAYSNGDNQFALFGFGDPTNTSFAPSAGDNFIAGIEDIYTGQGGGSDRDYQDELVQFTVDGKGTEQSVTPEPAAMTLIATGLVGLAASTRRRRKRA